MLMSILSLPQIFIRQNRPQTNIKSPLLSLNVSAVKDIEETTTADMSSASICSAGYY